ncbi:MAG: lysophospholipid acyltransferase family protein [Armatimonadetes bacterium]|nr:lysophospholipid acyltransferase family protein [Armatimonadota bacterium]
MKHLWKRVKIEIFWRLLWLISTSIAYTVQLRSFGHEQLDEWLASGKGGIIATWHGATMLPIFFCRHKGLWAIISRSRDGELQNCLVRSRGFNTIRGSSGSKGVRAFLEAAKRIKDGAVVAITPDGPRGPARVVQSGTVLLAERGKCAVLPIGVACRQAWRLRSWDKHMIPKPFASAVLVFGEPVQVGACETEEQRQMWAQKIGDALDQADADAAEALRGGI